MTGCEKKEGCTDPNAINYNADSEEDDGSCEYDTSSKVMLHVHSKMGTQDFAYGTEVSNWEGRKVKFSRVQAYLSGFKFHGDNGMEMIDDSYILTKPGTMMYEIGQLPNGHYDDFMFSVGVDSTANRLTDPASWPSEHALSSNNPDHAFWSWNTGYIFIVLEGQVDTTEAMNGTANASFVYHVGLDEMKRDIMFNEHQDVEDDVTINVQFDYLKLLDGIDMRASLVTHSMGDGKPMATAIADNVDGAFILE